MTHENIIERASSALLVIDVQEAFRSVIADFALIASRIPIAVKGFHMLDRPIFVTEQYPKGLGRSAEEILLSLPDTVEIIEKTAFSSCGGSGFLERIRARGIKHIAVCGLETHICVNQTVHDLLNAGLQVHILTDCVASRFEHDKQAGIAKMLSSGAIASSVEMSLFEMMRDSTHAKFKQIQELIK